MLSHLLTTLEELQWKISVPKSQEFKIVSRRGEMEIKQRIDKIIEQIKRRADHAET